MTEQLARAAHHEAGHVVGFLARGRSIAEVTIERCRHLAAHTTIRGFGDRGREFDDAVACLAGPEATRRWNPKRLDWRDENDFLAADRAVDRATGDWRSFSNISAYACRRSGIALHVRATAEQIAEHYWPEISAIADALLERKTIAGDTVERIFERSLQGRGR